MKNLLYSLGSLTATNAPDIHDAVQNISPQIDTSPRGAIIQVLTFGILWLAGEIADSVRRRRARRKSEKEKEASNA